MIIRAGRPALLFGPVAQLGERTVRIRKVEGSIPFSSTINDKKAGLSCFFILTKTASTIKITIVYLKEQVDACSQKSFF